MSQVIKNLNNGRITDAIANLYLCPASTSAIIKEIRLYNTDLGARTFNLYLLKAGGTPRRILDEDKSVAAGSLGGFYAAGNTGDSVACSFSLGAGDSIQGDADVTNKIDFVISGVEVT